jgi:hypothetical protein
MIGCAYRLRFKKPALGTVEHASMSIVGDAILVAHGNSLVVFNTSSSASSLGKPVLTEQLADLPGYVVNLDLLPARFHVPYV